ncbi:hypothetical protein CMI46_02430 [Candidatus Pacearchaeota archaeon]|nr:hypothetical protein [Candidatus Pacearchaeota archaeon]|tara:strand:+ start:1253 stop:1525 length:273 start_codon:yes stop_codon:yes gene_type:complete
MASEVRFYTVEYESEQGNYLEYFAANSQNNVTEFLKSMENSSYEERTLTEITEFELAKLHLPYYTEFARNKNQLCEGGTFHLGKLELAVA